VPGTRQAPGRAVRLSAAARTRALTGRPDSVEHDGNKAAEQMSVPAGALELDEQRADDSLTLALSGELDISTADQLQDAAARLCAPGQARELTLDLRRLTFVDSSGLAAVLFVSRLCERSGCQLSLIRGPQSVQHVFELTGLTELLSFRAGGDVPSPS
jgi:anti-anti-sigma factor